MKKKYIGLLFVILIAVFFRLFKLGEIPPSLTWDEVAWGYNAYSLGIDGRDEFGRFLPLDYLESFGDFKPPMYAYLSVLPIKIFGLTEFGTRFASAFFGVLTVLITCFLTKRILWNSPQKEFYGIFASLFLAISPWHIMLSRAAFEANVATFFLVLGVWSFLKGAQTKKWYFILSAVSFVLSLYTFNTSRIVSPLLVLILVLGFRKKLFGMKKHLIITLIVGLLLLIPLLRFLFTPQASLRFREVNIFSDIGVIETVNQQIENDKNASWSKVLHNRRFVYTVEYLRHFFDNLSPSFLFIKGDGNPKFSTQTVGQMYLWDLPFLITGILLLFRKKEGFFWIIPLWLLIGIIPAATARETPHALRIEATLPTFQILVAYGVVTVFNTTSNIKNQILKIRIKYLVFALYFLFLLFNFSYFFRDYLVHYPIDFSGEWQYGYKESINYVKNVQDKYDKIYITTALGRPYIYYLFYLKIDPRIFRKESQIKRNAFGFVTIEGFSKYQFVDSLNDKKAKKKLSISTPKNIPPKASIKEKFYLLNNDISLIAYE